MSQPEFSYSPLPSPLSIRLIHLEPGQHGDPICVNFTLTQLSSSSHFLRSNPRYEALSYTWGNVHNRQSIRCSSGRLFITEELFKALSHMRLAHAPRMLWIDAICINQDDIPERNHQVQLMGRIYSTAHRVVVWLGTGNARTRRIPQLVRRLVSIWDKRDESDTSAITDDEIHRFQLPPRDHADWEDFMSLLRSRWTTRIWVVQEVALSRHAIVLCGNIQMDWEEVAAAAIVTARGQILETSALAGTGGLQTVDEIRVQVRDFEHFNLAWELRHTRHFEATDVRDKVYALLALVDEDDRAAIRPDYAIDAATLFTQVARHLIESQDTLDVLMNLGFESTLYGLPSWVPDWGVAIPEDWLTLVDASHSAYWVDIKDSHRLPPGQDPRILETRGKIIDNIAVVSLEMWRPKQTSVPWDVEFAHVLDAWEELVLSLTDYPKDVYGDNSTDAYWKAIIAGSTDDNEEVDIEYGRYFLDWYKLHRKDGQLDLNKVSLRDSVLSKQEGIAKYGACVFDVCNGRMFGLTGKKYMGLFPRTALNNDRIALLEGSAFPIVLRHQKNAWSVVGACYVHGVWPDELMRDDSLPVRDFRIR